MGRAKRQRRDEIDLTGEPETVSAAAASSGAAAGGGIEVLDLTQDDVADTQRDAVLVQRQQRQP